MKLVNWKTSLAGVIAIAPQLATAFLGASSPWMNVITGIATGVGLLLAKDSNVTGGTKSHRLRRGDQVGRLRVIQILPTQVVFQVEEFGFERQQTLSLQRREINP